MQTDVGIGRTAERTRPDSMGAAPTVDPARPPAVQVFTLGVFRVVVHGQQIEDHAWRRKPARQLFKCLLSRATRRMTRDEVIELLWPESDPEAASSNLRSTLFAMRRVLEPGQDPIGIVFSDRDSIWLRPDVELWVDADEFEQTIQRAWRSQDPLPLLEQASTYYAGRYLADDLFEDWASQRRDALSQTWTELQLRLSTELERRGEVDGAAQVLHRLLQVDPCDERAARDAMHLLARNGRRADALRVYQRLRDALATELGVDPSAETTALHKVIAAGEFGEIHAIGTFRCSYPFPAPTKLIGRDAEIALLERVMSNARAAGQAVVVGAPAGTGKSALLGSLIAKAQSHGVVCLAGGCYEQYGTVPLGPFHDALVDFLLAQPPELVRAEFASTVEDLSQVVPELKYHIHAEPGATTAATIDRMRAFGAIHAFLRTLAERGPVLLCLEDLHAADEASLQFFHYLARQTRRLPVVLIGTYRSDEAPAHELLAQTVAAMARERIVEQLELKPLERTDSDAVVALLLDGSPSDTLGKSLFDTAAGNPLFLEQLVLALVEGGQLKHESGVWHGSTGLSGTPKIVREVISQRLTRLDEACRATLAMASVLGHSFDHKVLVDALAPGSESQVLESLDRAIAAHVLLETQTGYAFRHGLVREAVYWDLTAPRRMLLHRRAADILERGGDVHSHDRVAELARHYALSGTERPVVMKALRYSMLAGRQAASLSSNREALQHFARACELIERGDLTDQLTIELDALQARGQAQRNMGAWDDCITSFELVLKRSRDALTRARAYGAIGRARAQKGETAVAMQVYEAGLRELHGLDTQTGVAARLSLVFEEAVLWLLSGRFTRVLELGTQMLEAATTLGDPGLTYRAHSAVALALMFTGQFGRALRHYDGALQAADASADKLLRAIDLENVGACHYLRCDFESARVALADSVALYQSAASDVRAVLALQYLSRVWLAFGEMGPALKTIADARLLAIEAHDRWAAECDVTLGTVRSIRGEWDLAQSCFEQALRAYEREGLRLGIVEALAGLGTLHGQKGSGKDALRYFIRAYDACEGVDSGPLVIAVRRGLGSSLFQTGDEVRGREHIEAALAAAQAMEYSIECGPTHLAMAEVLLLDDRKRSREYAELVLAAPTAAQTATEAHILMAKLHRLDGQTRDVSEHATRALRLAERLESPWLMAKAMDSR